MGPEEEEEEGEVVALAFMGERSGDGLPPPPPAAAPPNMDSPERFFVWEVVALEEEVEEEAVGVVGEGLGG